MFNDYRLSRVYSIQRNVGIPSTGIRALEWHGEHEGLMIGDVAPLAESAGRQRLRQRLVGPSVPAELELVELALDAVAEEIRFNITG